MNSPDAFAFGTRNTRDDACNFAEGKPIKHLVTGEMVQRKTPYDRCAITDHEDCPGMMPLLLEKDSPLKHTPRRQAARGRQGRAGLPADHPPRLDGRDAHLSGRPGRHEGGLSAGEGCRQPPLRAGQVHDADRIRVVVPAGLCNLHHDAFFRDDEGPGIVYSAFGTADREDRWTYREIHRGLGHENFSIPQNANVSNGLMYALRTSYGSPIDRTWAGENTREVGAEGNAPPVGNPVDVTKATYTNDIGALRLAAVWRDPDFDPKRRASYDVRVLEIPTPRWSTYDSVRSNLPLSDVVPAHDPGARLTFAQPAYAGYGEVER